MHGSRCAGLSLMVSNEPVVHDSRCAGLSLMVSIGVCNAW